MKVGDLIYDSWAKLAGIILQSDFSLNESPWKGEHWDFLVLYVDGDVAGALSSDLEVINEGR